MSDVPDRFLDNGEISTGALLAKNSATAPNRPKTIVIHHKIIGKKNRQNMLNISWVLQKVMGAINTYFCCFSGHKRVVLDEIMWLKHK